MNKILIFYYDYFCWLVYLVFVSLERHDIGPVVVHVVQDLLVGERPVVDLDLVEPGVLVRVPTASTEKVVTSRDIPQGGHCPRATRHSIDIGGQVATRQCVTWFIMK